ncbi:hypothetical protein ACFSUK_05710 [Sphingobium scionense]
MLVLVNGKRRHNSSLLNLSTGSVDQGANSVDIDLIPAARSNGSRCCATAPPPNMDRTRSPASSISC